MKQKRRVLGLGVILLLCLLITGVAEAKTKKAKPSCPKTMTCYMYKTIKDVNESWFPEGYCNTIYIKNLDAKAKITNIVSSNKAVKGVAMNRSSWCRVPGISLNRKKISLKPGSKTKITFRVKQNKKTYKLKCTVTFVAANSPVASLKIGAEELASKLAGPDGVKIHATGIQTVSYTSAPGFEVTKVKAYKDGVEAGVVVENGGSVDTSQYNYLMIFFKSLTIPKYYSEPTKWINAMLPGKLYEYVMVYFE